MRSRPAEARSPFRRGSTGPQVLTSAILFLALLATLQPASAQEFEWARQFGEGTQVIRVAVDEQGNVITVGAFAGTADFDPGPGIFELTAIGRDGFVSKLDSAGDFVWAVKLGGLGHDLPFGVGVDEIGNVYTVGNFEGTVDFDPGPANVTVTSAGKSDVFVAKFDPAGNLLWAGRMGGPGDDRGHGVAVDEQGNVYAVGAFEESADFDPGPGEFHRTSAGKRDIFVSKLDSAGNFLWARGMGGPEHEAPFDVVVAETGEVLTAGNFRDTTDFDPGPAVFSLTSAGSTDIFVSKLDEEGNFVWARRMGGTSGDTGFGITVDPLDNVYTAGFFEDTADFDPGAGIFPQTSAGGDDVFVSKLDASGRFAWAVGVGGDQLDWATGIGVDSESNAYSVGLFGDTVDFHPGTATLDLTASGFSDAFVSKLDSSGNPLWTGRIGGVELDVAWGVTVDGRDNVYIVGAFTDTADLDPTPGIFQLTAAGGQAGFVVKLSNGLEVVSDVNPGSDPNSLNPRSRGVIPVAILTTTTAAGEPLDFDATQLDPASVTFGPAGARIAHRLGHLEDVDGDSDLDLLLHFRTRETGIECGDSSVSLSGETLEGRTVTSSDAIRTVNCR